MTLVYPLAAQIDHTELKFSLRSVEQYYPEAEVIIVSNEVPDWLTGVTVIEVGDIPHKKQWSIRRKILAALEYVSEFLFMNDDVYFTKRVSEFPYYWHGLLKKYSETGTRPLEKRLIELGKSTKLFDGHYPLSYDSRFKEVSQLFSDDCIIKSMYCNALEIEGEFAPDCKLLHPMKPAQISEFISNKYCFSTGTMSLSSAVFVLEFLFPKRSKFEAYEV